jgi:hypothetical protein
MNTGAHYCHTTTQQNRKVPQVDIFCLKMLPALWIERLHSYRLVVKVAYNSQTVLVKWIGTHAEYDKKTFP